MKTKNISETLGYITAINDVLAIINSMPDVQNIDGTELSKILLEGQKDLSVAKNEYYTMDKIDTKHFTKPIAGEDALFLNPVYELNKK